MNEYPSINDFITEGDTITLDKDAELEIIQYMEEYAQSVESNQTEAFARASTIVLNC